MTTFVAGYTPGAIQVALTSTAINTPGTSGEGMTLCQAANSACLDAMPAHFCMCDVGAALAYASPPPTGGSFVIETSYTPTAQARWLRIEATLPGNVLENTGSFAVHLSFTDGTTTVGSSSPFIANSSAGLHWNGVAIFGFAIPTASAPTSPSQGTDRYEEAVHTQAGLFDLNYLRSQLTASNDWTISFAITTVDTGYVLNIMGMELPRFVVNQGNDAGDYGLIVGDCFPSQPITDSTVASLGAILETVQAARVTQAVYLSLSWPQDSTLASGPLPYTSATTTEPFTNLQETSTAPVKFKVPVRQIYRGSSSPGELVRWRVKYATSGGAGLFLQMYTGSAASPFPVTLTNTGGASTWVWSAWQTGYLDSSGTQTRTGVSTNNLLSLPGEDTITFQGHVTGGSGEAFIAAIQVEGNAA